MNVFLSILLAAVLTLSVCGGQNQLYPVETTDDGVVWNDTV